MSVSSTTIDGKVIITLPSRFDFTVQSEFRESYQKIDDRTLKVVINFEHVTSLDSAALGMMLLMHDQLDSSFDTPIERRIELKKCNHEVKSILKIASFQQLFNIT